MILWRGEDSRHGISGEDADGLFGGGASPAGQGLEGRQPEPAASIAGGGQGREELGPRRSIIMTVGISPAQQIMSYRGSRPPYPLRPVQGTRP